MKIVAFQRINEKRVQLAKLFFFHLVTPPLKRSDYTIFFPSHVYK